jgi:electron transfer flavoprotein alpha subunit
MTCGPVCVFAEHDQGILKKYSLEKINRALKLAEELKAETAALVIGDEVEAVANVLARTGVTKVYSFSHPALKLYQPMVYADLAADWAMKEKPEIMLFSCSSVGADVAARVAAKLRTGLTAHCVDIFLEENEGEKRLVQAVPGWGGNLMLKIICPEKRPQMATVRPGICQPVDIGDTVVGEIYSIPVEIKPEQLKVKALEDVRVEESGVGLETAEIVVSGGWGMKSAGSLELLNKLSGLLKAEVAGTRPLVDIGWIEESRMIGVSGKNVAPKLFISIGASGAPHYTTGFDKSEVIFCINKDADAPVFDLCDLGIVGDLRQVLPQLISQLEAVL